MNNVSFLLEIATADLEDTERRLGQQSMAESVATAIETGRHLVVQAGTGTGKTLGYLVPLLASGKRAVIATVTKALQDQLASKDLPHACASLSAHLDREPTWAVLKGRSNYLCLQAFDELAADERLDLVDSETESLDKIRSWIDETTTGDLDTYRHHLSPGLRSKITVTADQCPGANRCSRGDDCFTERARRRAEEADIVVVNTHLYGLHLMSDGQLLPPHDVVVLDEAHQLEDVISDVASISLSPRRLQLLAGTVGAVVADERLKTEFQRSADDLAAGLAAAPDRRIDLDTHPELRAALISARDTSSQALSALGKVEEGRRLDDDTVRQKLIRASVETTRAIDNIDRFLGVGRSDVMFTEGSHDRPTLTLAPLAVGSLLHESLWSRCTSILTSATIPKNLTERIGLDRERAEMIDVGSPFNYEEQALLYCPSTIADPRSSTRDEEVTREIARLIRLSGGRTMALFTTVRAMRHHAAAIAAMTRFPVLVQDEMPRAALIEQFTAQEETCLFATAGFFQGVDVPGPTLSLVIIDKIPFPRPDDPLLEARRLAIGNRAFSEIDLPRAATMLAQAAGRLIRTTNDRGVVAVLDPRLATKPYGRELVAALPGFRRTKNFEDVKDFFGQLFS